VGARFVFVREKRSARVVKLAVHSQHGRLSGKTLHDALRAVSIDAHAELYLNLFRGGDGLRVDRAVLRRLRRLAACGLVVVGMGRKVQRALLRAGVEAVPLVHPAARGLIRRGPSTRRTSRPRSGRTSRPGHPAARMRDRALRIERGENTMPCDAIAVVRARFKAGAASETGAVVETVAPQADRLAAPSPLRRCVVPPAWPHDGRARVAHELPLGRGRPVSRPTPRPSSTATIAPSRTTTALRLSVSGKVRSGVGRRSGLGQPSPPSIAPTGPPKHSCAKVP
jgi:hypothetical protein